MKYIYQYEYHCSPFPENAKPAARQGRKATGLTRDSRAADDCSRPNRIRPLDDSVFLLAGQDLNAR
jgi:hypothetical protein